MVVFFFFFNDTATTEIYTLSLHDALPICWKRLLPEARASRAELDRAPRAPLVLVPRHRRQRQGDLRLGLHQNERRTRDRKSTRLNSSHANISYAVFCLKKKKLTVQLPPLD